MADNYKSSELAELAAVLATCAKPHAQTLHRSTNVVRNAVEDAKLLLNNARKLQQIGERECNGYPVTEYRDGKRYEYSQLTEAQQADLDKKRARCERTITDIVACYRTEKRLSDGNGRIYFQRDPRGAPVRVAFLTQTWIG